LSSAAPVERARELAGESRFLTFCRIGFFGRGVLYILIAWLVLQTGRTEDVTGALEYLGHGAGRIVLMIIAAGLAAYGLWRLADAGFGIDNPGRRGKALRKRAAAGCIGFVYLYLSYKALRILVAGHAASITPRQQADMVLHLPGGTIMLGIAAAGLAIGGLLQLRKAGKCSFLKPLDHRAKAPAIKWLGRIGYGARGVIFLTIGYLVAKAAIDGRSQEAGGTEQALDFLSGPVLYAVALGLMLFGAFSIVEALFRHLPEPPSPDEIRRTVAAKLG
jgi:hypothetical protein